MNKSLSFLSLKAERKFKCINGKWYLVYCTDENLQEF